MRPIKTITIRSIILVSQQNPSECWKQLETTTTNIFRFHSQYDNKKAVHCAFVWIRISVYGNGLQYPCDEFFHVKCVAVLVCIICIVNDQHLMTVLTPCDRSRHEVTFERCYCHLVNRKNLNFV